MQSYIAIFISVMTFVFTLYQWLIAMNSRRPNFSVHGFVPSDIRISPSFKYFQVYLDKWFLINLSALPNTAISASLYAKVGGQWKKGKFYYYHLSDPGLRKTLKSPFPVTTLGHSHFYFDQERDKQPLLFDFEGVLSEKELKKLNLKLVINDQYNTKHRFIYRRDIDFPDSPISVHPQTRWHESQEASVIDETVIVSPENETTVFQVVYAAKAQMNNRIEPQIVIEQISRNLVGKVASFSRFDSSSWKDDAVEVVKEFSNGNGSGMRINLENKIPKSIDLVFNYGKEVQKTVQLPDSFVASFLVGKDVTHT